MLSHLMFSMRAVLVGVTWLLLCHITIPGPVNDALQSAQFPWHF
jgi:hypothetical protein